MKRHFWVLIHRYAGLTMALFLILAGLTGSILVFYDELDDWLNPENSRTHTGVAVQALPMLDPFELRARALKLVPQARIKSVELQTIPGEAYTVYLQPRNDTVTGLPNPLSFDTLKLNPYTGIEVALSRNVTSPEEDGYFPLTRKNILPFIYALHYQLALGEIGGWAFGIAALIWTVDCFVGFYLTLPPRRKRSSQPNSPPGGTAINTSYSNRHSDMDWKRGFHNLFRTHLSGTNFRIPEGYRAGLPSMNLCRDDDLCSEVETTKQRGFWQRWKPAWQVKCGASNFRLNFDLHRAFGLWTWLMLFIFAWSSVMLEIHVFNNLPPVYDSVMKVFFDYPPEEAPIPDLPTPQPDPVINFHTAHAIGQRLMSEQAKLRGFSIKHETLMYYDETKGTYLYNVCTERNIDSVCSQTSVKFDAATGKLLWREPIPSGDYSGLTIKTWLFYLHMAKIWGLPYKILVCILGLVITMLSVTGVYIWWKKHRAANAMQKKTTSAVNMPGLNN